MWGATSPTPLLDCPCLIWQIPIIWDCSNSGELLTGQPQPLATTFPDKEEWKLVNMSLAECASFQGSCWRKHKWGGQSALSRVQPLKVEVSCSWAHHALLSKWKGNIFSLQRDLKKGSCVGRSTEVTLNTVMSPSMALRLESTCFCSSWGNFSGKGYGGETFNTSCSGDIYFYSQLWLQPWSFYCYLSCRLFIVTSFFE